jgi:hypothetical protein
MISCAEAALAATSTHITTPVRMDNPFMEEMS